jgi:hypothetical protein
MPSEAEWLQELWTETTAVRQEFSHGSIIGETAVRIESRGSRNKKRCFG